MAKKRKNNIEKREDDWNDLIQRFNALRGKIDFMLNIDPGIKALVKDQIKRQLNVLNTQSPSKGVCRSAEARLAKIEAELGLSNNARSR